MKNLSIENYIEIIKIIFKQFIFKVKVENFFLKQKWLEKMPRKRR